MRNALAPLLFLVALVPAIRLVVRVAGNDLGVNPAETLQLETGIWALRLLLITLAVTPLRRLSGWNRIIQYRRMLGLFAFFYATLHVLTYLVFDLSLAFGELLADVAKRPFITVGFVAFVAMVPLAATSTRAAIRRLGRHWQALHRLIYVSAVFAALHYLWKVKVVTGAPVYYAAGVAALLGVRAWWFLKTAKSLTSQPVKR